MKRELKVGDRIRIVGWGAKSGDLSGGGWNGLYGTIQKITFTDLAHITTESENSFYKTGASFSLRYLELAQNGLDRVLEDITSE
jgi:hypothetical protein